MDNRFKKVTPKSRVRRLIESVEGPEKTGKSHHAFTAPAPIVYFDTDYGSEGVVEKFAGDKDIYDYEVKTAKDILIKHKDTKGQGPQVDATEEFDRFKDAYYDSLNDKTIRTVVWDTATEVWELLRLAFFGKLAQVPPMKYGPANEEYRRLVRAAFDTDKNLILLHRVKDEYVGDTNTGSMRTGKKLRAGFNDTGFLVQLNVVTYFDSPKSEDGDPEEGFGLYVRDCRQNMGIAGMRLQGKIEGIGSMCSFPYLATSVFPDTELGDWK